jgi:dihydrofolate reductase
MKVIAIAAITADGMIARDAQHYTNWTSKADKQMFAAASRQAGVIILGRRTFQTFPKPLKDRLQMVLTTHPEAFASMPGSVEYTAAAPAEMLHGLEARQFSEVIIGGGASVYRQFIEAGLVDELWLTVEPVLFGEGISLLGAGSVDVHLHLLHVAPLSGDTLQLKYALKDEHKRGRDVWRPEDRHEG